MSKGVLRRKKTPPRIRFWRKVKIKGRDDCWEWRTGDGSVYPSFWTGKKRDGAHRYSLELRLGRDLKPGECALHSCDNKKCVNPAHLFPGTNDDNSKDMVKKGRKERGEEVHGAVLTPSKVLRIRRLAAKGWRAKRIAAVSGCTPDNVRAVVRGRSWKHVGGVLDDRSLSERMSKKLDLRKARKIKRLYEIGQYSMAEIGRRFDVCAAMVHAIVHGRAWPDA